jgi:hypothetical protein
MLRSSFVDYESTCYYSITHLWLDITNLSLLYINITPDKLTSDAYLHFLCMGISRSYNKYTNRFTAVENYPNLVKFCFEASHSGK